MIVSEMHEFVQLAPSLGERLRQDEDAISYEYCLTPPPGCEVFQLHDDVIGRNSGRIDGLRSDDWSGLSLFEADRMRYFCGFIGETDGRRHAGLNYYGITLLDDQALRYLTAPVEKVGAISGQDRLIISRFRNFCRLTQEKGLWLVHFGI